MQTMLHTSICLSSKLISFPFLCLTLNVTVLLRFRGIPYFILGLEVYFNDIIFLQNFISVSKSQLS